MVAVKTIFDGTQIEIPPEFRAVMPKEVILVFEEKPKSGHSIWDVVARSKGTRSGADIDEQIRKDREEWDAE